jgi:hypothetical protein
MVVEILESADRQELQKRINDFIIEKDKELRNRMFPVNFDVDVKVIPGFKSRYVAEDIEQHFIAVIQY